MAFGLLPEFSTPVQKPVEITGVIGPRAPKSLISRQFFEAKVRRAPFEAILGAVYPIPQGCGGRR
jgi:hypothetical protein